MLPEIDLFYLLVIWRVVLSALLGFAIAWERRTTGSPVRMRIIPLIAMTTAALTALGMRMSPADASRVLAGLMTGIGFIAAGMIMRAGTEEVRGLTTAASLWAMSCIAITVGAGYEVLGIVLTLLVYVVIAWNDWPLVTRLRQRRAEKLLEKEKK
jgi:putative Mg2+ transporter-C (MgtC) family protein